MMVELKYLRAEEVPTIPHRTESAQIVACAPLAEMMFDPRFDLGMTRRRARRFLTLRSSA
jgi:hypothetical protein